MDILDALFQLFECLPAVLFPAVLVWAAGPPAARATDRLATIVSTGGHVVLTDDVTAVHPACQRETIKRQVVIGANETCAIRAQTDNIQGLATMPD